MSDRLTTADVAFFYLESRTTPQHVGGIAIFSAPDGFDYDRLLGLLEERISLAPRYRQRIRAVPGNLANPVWVDDPNFDIGYHVRRSALPRPGTEATLLEFCARIQSRLLDRDRPLWEMYLVEGLSGDRVAIVTKTHPSMVDGQSGIDLTEVLLDASPEPRRTVGALWMPSPEPSTVRLVSDALVDAARRPAVLADVARLSMRDARSASAWATATATGLASAVGGAVRRSARPRRGSPLRTTLGQHRRIAIARAPLEDFREVRRRRGGTVNDVVLTVVTGALRAWLQRRGEGLGPAASVRALVPVSVTRGAESALGSGSAAGSDPAGWLRTSRVTGLLVDLPVGEADGLHRLAQVQYAMAEHATSGHPVGADALVGLSGFAPPTLHSLGARAAHGLTRRMYSIAVTNVPGPQHPLYAAGVAMTEMFPVMPLNEGQALSIALTSYDGTVCFGVNGDRDAVPDIDEVATLLTTALHDLLLASVPADIEPGAARRPRRENRT